ncbi:hypothetical protein [Flavobacterium aquicola]|uniref:Uncharacterized protein n=1 Tax=Flavobacterium aquicola TaxID=1682742 RepID=A0A3E0ED16_9FLAO|nr:hypothetical protein [Flavobacterium aquicola]REG96162.1 hypothetical protein C8P67_111136 [Flavobacterium aquicola]
MKKQAITLENLLNKAKKDFKIIIIDFLNFAPFSKQMIPKLRFIPEPYLSEYFKELLEEKKIFEVGVFYCNVSKTEQPFYGTQKVLTIFKSLQNGK